MDRRYYEILEQYGFRRGYAEPDLTSANLASLLNDLDETCLDPQQLRKSPEMLGYIPGIYEISDAFSTYGWYFDKIAVIDPISQIKEYHGFDVKNTIGQIQYALSMLYSLRPAYQHGHIIFIRGFPSGGPQLQDCTKNIFEESPDLLKCYARSIFWVDTGSFNPINLLGEEKIRTDTLKPAQRTGLKEITVDDEIEMPKNPKHFATLELHDFDQDSKPIDDKTLTNLADYFEIIRKMGWEIRRYDDASVPLWVKQDMKEGYIRKEQQFLETLSQSMYLGLPIVTSNDLQMAQIKWHGQLTNNRVQSSQDLLCMRDLILPYIKGASIAQIIDIKEKYGESIKQLRAEISKIVEKVKITAIPEELDYELSKIRISEIDPRIEEIKNRFRFTEEKWRVKGYGFPTVIGTLGLIGYFCYGEPWSFAAGAGIAIKTAVETWWNSYCERKQIQQNPFFYLWQFSDKSDSI